GIQPITTHWIAGQSEHTSLFRLMTEQLLSRDGEFLVRDSSSSTGEYVLSCMWKNQPMHFKIIRVVLRPKQGYTRELFQFEKDQFDNIPALIRFHVGGRHPISHSTGAIIFQPITRTLPLRIVSELTVMRVYSCHSNSDVCVRSGSQPANLETVGRPPAPASLVFRTGSEPVLSPAASCAAPPSQSSLGGCPLRGSDGQLHSRAPPKPLRISIVFTPTQPDSGPEPDSTGLYGELVPQVRFLGRKQTFYEWMHSFLGKHKRFAGKCKVFGVRKSFMSEHNVSYLFLHIVPDLYDIFLTKITHSTHIYLILSLCLSQVARVTGVTVEQKRIMGVETGLELITLPHGGQLRQDLLERHHTLALGVAVDLLGCTGTVSQRAMVLHRIIQLAQELRNTTHDLYAFSAVMKALELPQVVRLEMTWRALRRNHTDSAVTFEKSLKPFMKSLNEGDGEYAVVSGPLSLPHMEPLLRLMEGEDSVESTDRACQLLYNLLQSARNAAALIGRLTCRSLLPAGWEPIPELLEVFQTEFALRLFWGQMGAKADRKERYAKFDRILTVLSNKLEPDGSSEV
uniref:SH2 domain containing 3A n=1 Tax=Sinocyclocheilus grahami TaxID=75366 RepID=A0A672KQ24_SINGR